MVYGSEEDTRWCMRKRIRYFSMLDTRPVLSSCSSELEASPALGLVFGNVAVMLGPLAFIYVLKQFEPIAASWIFLLMGRGKCLKYPMREVCNAQQFLAAAVSTCFSLLRSVMGQETLSMKGWSQKKTNLNGPNLIAVMQAMTGALLTPILLLSQIVHLLSWNLNSPSLVLVRLDPVASPPSKLIFTFQLHKRLSPISYSLGKHGELPSLLTRQAANQVKTLVYIASAARFFGPAMPVKVPWRQSVMSPDPLQSFLASTVTTASLILYSKELARSYESVRQTVSK
ncbi:hypothetical protein GUITHDRAFT_116389 [Guillardia theta CCMP2712]|uniref:Uncharacterized protein n=1 Tax=Guillardia theta (strain CCMP2712) TaxID=905079 RepID=L1IMC5_GUITC|nr:hypothetical protein GUITHDRAFT_116389 [Guillardia theta CCMP2712]EKX37428.1 hypothetical protein GUITHDRAFT_116389 [Guillardia theta CCMP2712]|eukprot:XP_005824408.1 hypothetical protein GUITHDRAFT_116389 [Guillardia theta CCMP2712]